MTEPRTIEADALTTAIGVIETIAVAAGADRHVAEAVGDGVRWIAHFLKGLGRLEIVTIKATEDIEGVAE